MKTKTIMFGVVMVLAFAVFASSLVLADENTTVPMLISENTNNTQSNVSDVSSSTVFWKQVGIWFTFNQERKMEKEMELAQLRLQQAEYATQNNMTKAAEKALDSYEKLMRRVSIRSEAISESSNISIGALKLAAMEQSILVHENRIQRLTNLLETANLTEEQKILLEAKIAQAENVTSHLEQVQASKEEKVKTRLMAQKNLTEAEAESIIENTKEGVSEMTTNAKAEWKEIKEQAAENNMTPAQYVRQNREEIKNEIRNSISKNSGSNESD